MSAIPATVFLPRGYTSNRPSAPVGPMYMYSRDSEVGTSVEVAYFQISDGVAILLHVTAEEGCGPSVNTLAPRLPSLGTDAARPKAVPKGQPALPVPDPLLSSVNSGYPSQLLVVILPGWHPGLRGQRRIQGSSLDTSAGIHQGGSLPPSQRYYTL